MADFRGKCRARAKFLFNNRCDSSDKAFVTKRLTQTLTQLEPVLIGIRYSFSSKAQIKDHISKNNILELYTDASLILRHVDAIFSNTESVECAKAIPASAGLPGIYAHGCFDRIPVVDMPPLARQIESCLIIFAKKMNLS